MKFRRSVLAAAALALAVCFSFPAFAEEEAHGPALEIAGGYVPPKPAPEAAAPQQVSLGDINAEYLGEFRATAYCASETGSDMTASGLHARSGHTISADWSILPKGTKVYIDGVVYTVEDNGVWGNSVDIFFDTYQECINYGLKKVSVYRVVE
ncbi:MAG: 3D domain-containing protein [Clostridium sp.]|nr:3D domain-containing protein [Clostridium sp.]